MFLVLLCLPPISFKMIKVFWFICEQFISVKFNLVYVNIGEISNLFMNSLSIDHIIIISI